MEAEQLQERDGRAQGLLRAAHWLGEAGDRKGAAALVQCALGLGPEAGLTTEGPSGPPTVTWTGLPVTSHALELSFLKGALEGQKVSIGSLDSLLGRTDLPVRFEVNGPELRVVDRTGAEGLFINVRGEERISPGTEIRAGNRVFRFDAEKTEADRFVLHQLDAFGAIECTVGLADGVLSVGRAGYGLCYPHDSSLAPHHFEVTAGPWAAFLLDCSDGEGTYTRRTGEAREALSVGDRFWAGGHLVRIDGAGK